MIIFAVPGQPVGKGRPRFVAGKGLAHGRTYTPEATKRYEATVAACARQSLGPPSAFPDGPLTVSIDASAQRPKRLARRLDPDGPIWRTTKPDPDNVAKAVLDALSPWFDDARVVDLRVRSLYAGKGCDPAVTVTIEQVESAGPGEA